MAHLGVKIKFTKFSLDAQSLPCQKRPFSLLRKVKKISPTFKEYVRACAHRVHKTNLPVMISSQAIRKMFMYFLGSTYRYMQHVTLYILRLERMQGWKSH